MLEFGIRDWIWWTTTRFLFAGYDQGSNKIWFPWAWNSNLVSYLVIQQHIAIDNSQHASTSTIKNNRSHLLIEFFKNSVWEFLKNSGWRNQWIPKSDDFGIPLKFFQDSWRIPLLSTFQTKFCEEKFYKIH